MEYFCIILVVILFVMCLMGVVISSMLLTGDPPSDVRPLALFNLFKAITTVVTLVLLLFVFSSHLQCNKDESAWGKWEIINHGYVEKAK